MTKPIAKHQLAHDHDQIISATNISGIRDCSTRRTSPENVNNNWIKPVACSGMNNKLLDEHAIKDR